MGIKDKRSPIDFKDPPSHHQERVSQLLSFYKEFALQDQAEREKVKKVGRRGRSFGGLLDPSKFVKGSSSDSPTQVRRASLLGPWNKSIIDKMAAQSTDCPDEIPESFYTGQPELKKIATVRQRLLDPTHQPARVEQFTPRPLHLIGKKLLRCKGCDHILLKGEINPSSIRFKIQQIAPHTFPQVRIFKPPSLVVGEESEVFLSVSNPASHVVSLSFQQLEPSFKEGGKFSLAPASLPEGSYQLSPSDDMGDLLDDAEEEELEGKEEFIHSRLLGKLVLKFKVTPEEGTTGEVKFGFVLSFDYKSIMELEKQEASCMVPVPIVVDLGKLTPPED